MGELPGVGVSAAHDAAAATSLDSGDTSNIFNVHTRYFSHTHHRGGEELGGELLGGGRGHGGQAEDEEDSHAVSSGQHEIYDNQKYLIQ